MNKPSVAFFQPSANFPILASMGINTVAGPEPTGMDQALFAAQAATSGLSVILKNPVAPLPPNCGGLLLTVDEPNEPKGNNPPIPAAALKPNFDALRALSPTLPIYLTLGGDRFLYPGFPNAADRALLLGYAAMGDVSFAVDFYPCNRSSKYPMNTLALACANLASLTGKPVFPIFETNDQQLGPPTPPPGAPPETNGAPTPAQIKQQFDAATVILRGAWWFFTCPALQKQGWPAKYMPPVDRNGVSMAPQYAMVKQCNAILNPGLEGPTPAKSIEDRVSALEAQMKAIAAGASSK
jgi:hypothetical protein